MPKPPAPASRPPFQMSAALGPAQRAVLAANLSSAALAFAEASQQDACGDAWLALQVAARAFAGAGL